MYYIIYNGQSVGPMTASQAMAYHLNADTPVSVDGTNWQPLYNYPELMSMLNTTGAASSADNKRVVAGICALILGTLGIQYFVIGKPVAGILTILLSIVTCGLWGIVMLVQGILILTMSDAEFERKFVNTTSTLPIF